MTRSKTGSGPFHHHLQPINPSTRLTLEFQLSTFCFLFFRQTSGFKFHPSSLEKTIPISVSFGPIPPSGEVPSLFCLRVLCDLCVRSSGFGARGFQNWSPIVWRVRRLAGLFLDASTLGRFSSERWLLSRRLGGALGLHSSGLKWQAIGSMLPSRGASRRSTESF